MNDAAPWARIERRSSQTIEQTKKNAPETHMPPPPGEVRHIAL